MKVYLMLLLCSIIISIVLMSLMIVTSFASNKDLEKNSPFECGFLGYEESRSPFSVHFFVVSLIFFDLWCSVDFNFSFD